MTACDVCCSLPAGSAPDVQLTDFAFAAHALLVSLFTLYQCFLYGAPTEEVRPQPPQQQLLKQSDAAAVLGTSRTCQLTTAGVAAAVVFFSGHISTTCGTSDCNAWLPMLYLLGTIKVSMTLIKYTPQALLNHRRRSTEGWQINNVLLDLAGGLLSFGQIGLNALSRNDMSVVTGNPAKLGISLISIGFDVIFILQHYVLYKGSSTSSVDDASSAAAAAVGNRRLVLVPVRAEVGSSTGTGTATGRRRRAASVTANAAAAGGGAAGGVTGREQRPGRRSSCGQ
jgi:cystinosin